MTRPTAPQRTGTVKGHGRITGEFLSLKTCCCSKYVNKFVSAAGIRRRVGHLVRKITNADTLGICEVRELHLASVRGVALGRL
jgi:hypothetical protein